MPHTAGLLVDLLAHMEWADAEHWRVVSATPAAWSDRTIRMRLHHIHLVQHAFLSIVSGSPFEMTEADAFSTPGMLRDYARGGIAALRALLAGLDEAGMARRLTIPWFKDPPIEITVSEALTQVAMHSQHHRGQNATRLRELGAEPPTTDIILWWWKERPSPQWD